MKLNKIDQLVLKVERGEYEFKQDDYLVKVMQWFYNKLYQEEYSIQETIDYLTASINQYSINYSLDIENAIRQYESSKLSSDNLVATFYDSASNSYDLQFGVDSETVFVTVSADDFPEAATDEDYWDDEENINRAIKG